MKHLALFLLLLLPACTPAPKPYDAALRDGSVIFWRGGPLTGPILRNTDSDLTHAAIVLYVDREPWVYEAVPPCVHKVPMNEYREHMEHMREKQRISWFVMQPVIRFSPDQLAAMKAHAESQIGRPYMLRGWWLGHEVRGIFCSQLVGDVIAESGKIESGGVHESPGSLCDKLLPFYTE
ncbi:MAG: C40 family peptidase [Candidatus Cryosericum sp.]